MAWREAVTDAVRELRAEATRLEAMLGEPLTSKPKLGGKKKSRLSAAGRAAISAAAKKRWRTHRKAGK